MAKGIDIGLSCFKSNLGEFVFGKGLFKYLGVIGKGFMYLYP
jgi:hypothetical protein